MDIIDCNKCVHNIMVAGVSICEKETCDYQEIRFKGYQTYTFINGMKMLLKKQEAEDASN